MFPSLWCEFKTYSLIVSNSQVKGRSTWFRSHGFTGAKRASKLEFTRRVACNAAGRRIAASQGPQKSPKIPGRSWSAKTANLGRHILGEAFVDQVANVQCPETWESYGKLICPLLCRSVFDDISRLDKFPYLIKSHCWWVIHFPHSQTSETCQLEWAPGRVFVQCHSLHKGPTHAVWLFPCTLSHHVTLTLSNSIREVEFHKNQPSLDHHLTTPRQYKSIPSYTNQLSTWSLFICRTDALLKWLWTSACLWSF